MTRYFLAALLALAACAPEQKDYDAMRHCGDLGYSPGTSAYDKCIKDEKTARLLEQQEQEYDQMKQQQQDYILRRY